MVCTKCGNGICESWEGPCNCRVDCPVPVCGDGITEDEEECGEPGRQCPSDSICQNCRCLVMSSSSSSSSLPPVCGNGILEAGEDCLERGLLCPSGSTCQNCRCLVMSSSSSSSSSSSHPSFPPQASCSNGVLDQYEQCDWSVLNGECTQPGYRCTSSCSCERNPMMPNCGNRRWDTGEKCDPPGLVCGGGTCNNTCQCVAKSGQCTEEMQYGQVLALSAAEDLKASWPGTGDTSFFASRKNKMLSLSRITLAGLTVNKASDIQVSTNAADFDVVALTTSDAFVVYEDTSSHRCKAVLVRWSGNPVIGSPVTTPTTLYNSGCSRPLVARKLSQNKVVLFWGTSSNTGDRPTSVAAAVATVNLQAGTISFGPVSAELYYSVGDWQQSPYGDAAKQMEVVVRSPTSLSLIGRSPGVIAARPSWFARLLAWISPNNGGYGSSRLWAVNCTVGTTVTCPNSILNNWLSAAGFEVSGALRGSSLLITPTVLSQTMGVLVEGKGSTLPQNPDGPKWGGSALAGWNSLWSNYYSIITLPDGKFLVTSNKNRTPEETQMVKGSIGGADIAWMLLKGPPFGTKTSLLAGSASRLLFFRFPDSDQTSGQTKVVAGQLTTLCGQCGDGTTNSGELCGEPGLSACPNGKTCQGCLCVTVSSSSSSSSFSSLGQACGNGIAETGEVCGEPGLSCPSGKSCQRCQCILGASSSSTAPTLCPVSILPANQTPSWMTSADFNVDGHTDLAVLSAAIASAGNHQILSIYISNGNGTFQPKADYFPAGSYRGIAAGDFDRDGHPDLALSGGGGFVSILRNNGNGQFSAIPEIIALTQSSWLPQQITVGDVNGDGDLDIIVGLFSDGAQILYGASGVGFTLGPKLGTVGGNQLNPTFVDVNADGFLDAVTTPAGTNGPKMTVYLNDQTGLFGSGTSYDSTGNNPYTLNLFSGDVNGDGKADLLQATNNGEEIIVWLNNGNGTFWKASTFAAGNGNRDGALADFNGDGKRDLFVGTYVRGFTLYQGNGNGTFAPPVNIGLPVVGRQVVAEDFDRDGHLDFAMSLAENRNGILVLLNKNSCLLGGTVTSSSASSLAVSSALSSASSVQAAPCGNGRVDAAENCDDGNTVNGDGCSAICRFECTDTDPNDDPSIRGVVRSFYCPNGTLSCGETVQQDSCIPGTTNMIVEYSCSQIATYYGAISALTHSCAGNQVCDNGICGYGTAQSSSSSLPFSSSSSFSSAGPVDCGNGIKEGNEQCEVGITCPPINCLVAPCPQQHCNYQSCSCVLCPVPTPPACPGGVLFPQLGVDVNGCEQPPVCCEGAASGGQCTTNMSCTNGRCIVDSCTCSHLCPDPTPPACPGGVLFPQLGVDVNGCEQPPVCCEGAASGGQCTTNMSCTNGRCIVDSCSCLGSGQG
ncbi:MAG: FG-GAP-like repeat-containing protein [Candidatus Peribacteraceae bacterium]|nr:FG-GAP-like repeat-containing protein [Candidatus Peribacteraceae bacterium]